MDSQTAREVRGVAADWDQQVEFLAQMVDELRAFRWVMTKLQADRFNDPAPEPIRRPDVLSPPKAEVSLADAVALFQEG